MDPLLRIIEATPLPPGTLLVVTHPTRQEAQLMAGMGTADRVLFMAYLGRLVMVGNVGAA